jgi:hypothetical protein
MPIKKRQKFLYGFWLIYLMLAVCLYWGLKVRLKNKFSEAKMETMLMSVSESRDKTSDPCRYQILGDPKDSENYIKVEIDCKNGQVARSTMSLLAIEDKTMVGVLKEYGRVIGFNGNFGDESKMDCNLDGIPLNKESGSVPSKVTIKCVQK